MKQWVLAYNARSNGLGNRLRVTLGARNLARARGRHFAAVWPTGPLFQPRFRDLFRGQDWPDVPWVAAQALGRFVTFRDEHLDDIDVASSSPVWLIRTGGVLQVPGDVRSWEEDLRELHPVQTIADKVTQLHSRFGDQPYLGVQVRTHAVSHGKTREASPVDWFTTRLDAIRRDAPELRFYFSCDVAEVQRELIERYPGSVGLDDKGAYNSVQGVQSGVVDLFLLASAGYVLGPAHSSFVELAVRLADHAIPFENSLKEPQLAPDTFTRAPDPLHPALRG